MTKTALPIIKKSHGISGTHSSEGDNLQRCPRQISKSYNNSQLHPRVNRKLVKTFEDKESRWRGENGGKEKMSKMERIPAGNRKEK